MANSVKVKVINKTTLELDEDAKKGDYIELDKVTTLDTTFINDLINKNKEVELNKRVKEALIQKEKEFNELKNAELRSKENELSNAFNTQISKLNQEILELKAKKIQEITDLTYAKDKEIANLNNEIKSLNERADDQLSIKMSEYDKKHNEETDKLKEGYEKQIENFKKQLFEKETAIKNFDELKNKDIEIAVSKKETEVKEELNKKFEEEREKYNEKINQLQRQKSSYNTKQIGEDLEVWCNHEVESYMQNGLFNCSWEKDNTVVKNEDETKGSKADFIFKVYASPEKKENELLTSLCLDMKEENPDSVNKKQNKDYYPQLDKNRIKKQCEYAVLVSTLESNKANDIPIFKVSEYKNMYVVRPEYLMTFLNMIVSLNTTFAELKLAKNREDIKYKNFDDFDKDFESLKNTYLDKPLAALNKNIEILETQNKNISAASEKIGKTIEEIKTKYIEDIEKKLENFSAKVKKAYKKLDE